MILRFSGDRWVGGSGETLVLAGWDPGFERAPEGRPFPAEDAEGRLAELRERGIGAIRLGMAQEFLEGTGTPNEAWLAYARKILLAAERLDMAVFAIPVPKDEGREEPGPQERFLAACRHAARRFKNCRAISAWGVAGGVGPWPRWIPAPEAENFVGEFRRRMGETHPEALFFTERYPDGGAEDFARRTGLVPPSLIRTLFG